MIAGIIIGSVILISIVACIVNCICCGYRCCTACCGCCCPSGKRKEKKSKYYDDPPLHQPQPSGPAYQQPTTPAPPVYRGAIQTATFDSAKSPSTTVNEDALPEMPTWASAVDKHVEDTSHKDDVEMEPLNPQGQVPDRKHGADTPLHPINTAYADRSPDRATPKSGYRGFAPTDPYARRSPAPATTLAATQDPYGRRSPGGPSPVAAAAVDPYGRRSPGPAAAYGVTQDPYGRRSPGPAAVFAAAQDPYSRRSPGMASPVGAANHYDHQSYGQQSSEHQPYDHQPYDHQSYDHQPYDDYSPGGGNSHAAVHQYQGVTSASPVAAYNPHTNYGSAPMAYSPSSEAGHNLGFQRQPSFGSSQYPPTYTSQPPYRAMSPSVAASPPPPFSAHSPSQFHAHEYGTAIGSAVTGEPSRERPPSLLQSGRKPTPKY